MQTIVKQCPQCLKTKEVNTDNFIRSKMHDADGFSSVCRSCHVQQVIAQEKELSKAIPHFDSESTRSKKKQVTKAVAAKKLEIDRLLDQGLKECSHCHQVKGVFDFGLNERTYSGLNSRCKQCANEIAKKHQRMKKEANDNRDSNSSTSVSA
jgi:hypothetical protein